jgi:hypothetical protein
MSTDLESRRREIERQVKEEARGKEFAKAFSDFVNIMSNDQAEQHAIDAMLREHRTLQQSMMGFIMKFIEQMSKQNHDLRNEASVKLAQRIMDIPVEDRILPFV